MDQPAYKTTIQSGPFETWRNPTTGEESQFISFPVVNGRIASEVTLGSEEHGQYMEWTFRLNNMPESTPETMTMTRKPAAKPEPEEPAGTAVPRRPSPRLFVAAYVVIALVTIATVLLR